MTTYKNNIPNMVETISTEELEKELERRRKVKEENEKPRLIEEPDLTNLENLLFSYVDYISSDDFHEDNDYERYIIEKVIATFFGPGFWDWYNEKVR